MPPLELEHHDISLVEALEPELGITEFPLCEHDWDLFYCKPFEVTFIEPFLHNGWASGYRPIQVDGLHDLSFKTTKTRVAVPYLEAEHEPDIEVRKLGYHSPERGSAHVLTAGHTFARGSRTD